MNMRGESAISGHAALLGRTGGAQCWRRYACASCNRFAAAGLCVAATMCGGSAETKKYTESQCNRLVGISAPNGCEQCAVGSAKL